MKKNNVSSTPNNMVAIICKVIKGVDEDYLIDARTANFGKIEEYGTDFYCMDNKKTYKSLKDNLYNLNLDEEYYCFEKSIDELKNIYGKNKDNCKLALDYLKTICSVQNSIEKEKNEYSIHCVNKTIIRNATSDPVEASKINTIEEDKEEKKDFSSVNYVKDHSGDNGYINNVNLRDFEKYLKDRVIGNERVVENMGSSILYNLRTDNSEEVSNILNIGPTGTGKTYTCKTIAKYLDIPFVRIDCSNLSTAGYFGDNINDILVQLYEYAKGDIKIANKSIILLDEIDKIANTKLEIKEQAQRDLLNLTGGNDIRVTLNAHSGKHVMLNTGCMTFVAAGAFSELYHEKMNPKREIGIFPEKQKEEMERKRKQAKFEITDKDLIKYGLKDEFIGRFPKVNIYDKLDKEGLKRVLVDAKESILKLKMETYLNIYNTELTYDSSFIDAAVARAIELERGGRSLNKVMADVFERLDREIQLNDFTKHKRLVLTRKIVDNPDSFKLVS